MVTWEVMVRDGEWGLFIREYSACGINPEYRLFRKIDEAMARYLTENRLANDLYGRLG